MNTFFSARNGYAQPKVRSPWRQRLIDDAYRDIDACECHTDFILAIVKHTKAWLAEANQWNEIPTGANLELWNNFKITHPDFRLTYIDSRSPACRGSYWISMHLSSTPGDVSAGAFLDALPFSQRVIEPIPSEPVGTGAYSHVAQSSSKHHASGTPTVELAYLQRMVEADGPTKATSYRLTDVEILSRKHKVRHTLNTLHSTPGASWLGQQLETARSEVRGASTIKALQAAVERHMPTWYAAAQEWIDGPPDAAAAERMTSFSLPLTWRYDGYATDADLGMAGAGGPVLKVQIAVDKHEMIATALAVLRELPIGLALPCNGDSLAFDRYQGQKQQPFTMSCVASPLYSELGATVVKYGEILTALGERHYDAASRYEASVASRTAQCEMPLSGVSI